MTTERRPRAYPPGYEPPRRVSVEEYLRLEAASTEKHEYWHGWMYQRMYPPGSHWALSGGTAAHSRLITSIIATLYAHLLDGPCVLYQGDMRLYVNDDVYYYPDAFVTCGSTADPTSIAERDATLVVEVLSPSTASFDLNEKLDAYGALPSLREYVLFDARRIQATLFRRADADVWLRLSVLEGADLVLESIDLRVPLARIYRGVQLEPEVPDAPDL